MRGQQQPRCMKPIFAMRSDRDRVKLWECALSVTVCLRVATELHAGAPMSILCGTRSNIIRVATRSSRDTQHELQDCLACQMFNPCFLCWQVSSLFCFSIATLFFYLVLAAAVAKSPFGSRKAQGLYWTCKSLAAL